MATVTADPVALNAQPRPSGADNPKTTLDGHALPHPHLVPDGRAQSHVGAHGPTHAESHANGQQGDVVQQHVGRSSRPQPDASSIEEATVLTRSSLGFIRKNSTPETVHMLHYITHQKQMEVVAEKQKEAAKPPRFTQKPPMVRANTSDTVRHNGTNFGEGGYGDKFTAVWDWPIGRMDLVDTDEAFEVQFEFAPFKPNEITVKVMGHELIVHCKANRTDFQREVFRTYQLPLNVDPTSIIFILLEHRNRLKIMSTKTPAIKLAVASYIEIAGDKMTKAEA